MAAGLGRKLVEVPVGFKWFVDGLLDGSLGFGGEESAGASFLRQDGTRLDHRQGRHPAGAAGRPRSPPAPARTRASTTARSSPPRASRSTPASTSPPPRQEKARLGALAPADVTSKTLAGEPIAGVLTRAPGNGAPIGGLKVTAENGWFAARPSGTENIYKIYAESFRGKEHLTRVIEEARALVKAALAGKA